MITLRGTSRGIEMVDNDSIRRYDGAAMEQGEETAERGLREITEALVREYQPERIILFGSRAWGRPHKDSDADLCVLKDHQEDPLDAMGRAFSIAVGARRQSGVRLPLDVIVYTPRRFDERLRMGDPFVKRIATHGRLLYDARRR